MQSKLNNLRETEENLDRLCRAMRLNIKYATKDPTNNFFTYVTRDDLLEVFGTESVILTVRNCDTIRQGPMKVEDNTKKHTLQLNGRWKAVDVRLVTTDGEVVTKQATATVTTNDVVNLDGESSETTVSASQPESKTVATYSRRPGRRRKPDRIELKDDDEAEIVQSPKSKQPSKELTPEEIELQEKRITAETLLGYKPPYKQRKRQFEEDWLESRYKLFRSL